MFPSKKTTDLQQQVEDLRLEIAKRDAKIDILEAQQTIVVNNVGDPSAAEKLAAVTRFITGEASDEAAELRRQMGLRLGFSSSPDDRQIFERLDALQKIAVQRDAMRRVLSEIVDEDVEFQYECDRHAFAEFRKLLG